jgi:glycosyltransferase involved in cell wall biosynthesis
VKIGVIAPPWEPVPPVAYGGTEAVVDTLARGFAAEGHDVVLFTTGESTCPVDRRFTRQEADTARMNWSVPEAAHVLAAYDELDDCDVVHDHTIVGPLVGALRGRAPVIATVHGRFDAELSSVYAAISQHAAVVAISHTQRADAHGVRIARTIHHGVDPDRFAVGAGDGGYLLFLGRMAPEKGAHRAVEVARRAGLPLLLAGKMHAQDEHEYFDEHVRPQLGPNASYLGEVDDAEKLRLLRDARALVNPIRWREPFGLVMIEALACGTPVLAFPEGAASEIVVHGTTGYLCTDERDMATAAERVDEIERPACRAAVAGYFSAARMVREHLDLAEAVVDGLDGAWCDVRERAG